MVSVVISNTGKTITCKEGNLLDILLDAGVFIENPCNGKGICGKCKVCVQGEECSLLSETEKKYLKPQEIETGVRLACMTEVHGNVEITLLQEERAQKILTSGYVPEFIKDEFKEGWGICIDIGTTTVAAALIELRTGEEICSDSWVNEQKQYGLDVLTRITYEYEQPEYGAFRLQKAIVQPINAMIRKVCTEAGIDRTKIREITIAANCTMMHMFLGVDARPIGRAPYQPKFLKSQTLQAKEIGIEAGEDTILYCLPHVSAYIGADIVAGAYVCGLEKTRKKILFIDIGTNGEIVLAVNGRLFCCSCAAGPALEGMNISSGMRAAKGAIEDVRITEQGVEVTTIGGGAPLGVCGSGILAVVKELLHSGIVKKTGVFIKTEELEESDFRHTMIRMNGRKREFVLYENPLILVTQGDVRQVQLAKGAILSGFKALLSYAGLRMEELDEVMIAGQFGSHLPAKSLVGTGILPEGVEGKLVYVGNSSKTGAYMALMSRKIKQEMEELAKKMEYIELAETKNYERLFAESMIFPDYSGK